jgi:hypothetical protein
MENGKLKAWLDSHPKTPERVAIETMIDDLSAKNSSQAKQIADLEAKLSKERTSNSLLQAKLNTPAPPEPAKPAPKK